MENRRERGRGWPSRRALCGALAAATLLPSRAFGRDGDAVSAWSVSDHARVRLIDAGFLPRDTHVRLAGIEIELDPQYLTYWRSPGDAGVPPAATFAGSINLRSATLLYPAPGRFSEDGSEAIGYKSGVIFPLLVTAVDAGESVTLALDLSFATCERLCVPAHARCQLMLESPDDGEAAEHVRDALARVPAPAAVGKAGPLTITAVTDDPGQSSVTVLARASGSDIPLLFAEAPDPWFVQAGAGLWTNDGSLKYSLNVLSRPADPAAMPLRLTLVGLDSAIEVSLSLDAPSPKP